jgi:uncharacterized lipoprotein YddW (UPF0748 family)
LANLEKLLSVNQLTTLINQAHRQGMLVIPCFEFGLMVSPGSELTLKHPNWLTQKRDGSRDWVGAAGGVEWLNPFHPDVQKFITDLVLEIVTQYDVDGIQFDDHTSLPIQEAQQKIPAGVGVLTGLRTKLVPMPLIQAKVRSAQERGLGISFFYYESLWELAQEPIPDRQATLQTLFTALARRSTSDWRLVEVPRARVPVTSEANQKPKYPPPSEDNPTTTLSFP